MVLAFLQICTCLTILSFVMLLTLQIINGNGTESLETLALTAQICLKMHRADAAGTTLKRMIALNDDATLTQVSMIFP